MKYLAALYFFFFPFFCHAQTDSCNVEVSLLTCSPGEELYATFGHTAIRVKDSIRGIDEVYNYGTFQFGPHFYTDFIKGKLDYSLSVEAFEDFIYAYRYDSRSVFEQKLLLSCAAKAQLIQALHINAQEENRYYRYDFLKDNCTTRAKNIIVNNLPSPPHLQNIINGEAPTYRNLLYIYLNNGAQHWSKAGIDLLLGSRLDKKVTSEEALFLPDNLMKAFEGSRMNNQLLAAPAVVILNMPSPLKGSAWLSPLVAFSLLFIFIAVLSFIRNKKVQKAIALFDFIFFIILGLVGCLLLFMWFGTEHLVCRDNFNLLWALPTHTIAAFALHTNKRWMQYYLLFTMVLATVLLIGSPFLPQQFNLSFFPIILLILLRCWLIILKPHDYDAANNPL